MLVSNNNAPFKGLPNNYEFDDEFWNDDGL